MAFSHVPTESKNQINKAGELLRDSAGDPRAINAALDLVGRWRACHAYPINTFQATLRGRLKQYSNDPIAAQRLKRMPTIIEKLRRYPAMKVTTMQDIAGVRAILRSPSDVLRLAKEYRSSTRLRHALVDEKDYINAPRDEDGYRSVHLIYKYKNPQAEEYNGLRLELQIRTRLQHTWATAVESMGTFLGQALKSRQGDREWIDFFALVSAAFAHIEKTAPIGRFSGLSRFATYRAVKDAEASLDALAKMEGLSVAVQTIPERTAGGQSSFFHLITLNSLEHTVSIRAYDRMSFERAVQDYAACEARAASGERIEPVLVSAGPVERLRKAYPNFFLDIGEFVKTVKALIAKTRSSASP